MARLPVKRVVIAEEHESVRSALAVFFLIQDDFELVAEAASGQEAVKFCAVLGPDILLLDNLLLKNDPVTLIRLIRDCSPQTQIVLLTHDPGAAFLARVLEAGVTKYVFKDAGIEALIKALHEATNGAAT